MELESETSTVELEVQDNKQVREIWQTYRRKTHNTKVDEGRNKKLKEVTHVDNIMTNREQ